MILILISASAEPTNLRGGSMNRDDEDDSDGGDCSDESCEISYGQPYHLQLVSENQDLQRWLTGSRSSPDRYGRPRGGNGNYVYTDIGADNGGNAGNYKINPNQYRWLIGSDESDGSRLDENGQAIWEDPKRNECMRYGDLIYLQGLGTDNHWLTGRLGTNNQGVYMASTADESQWHLRSSAVRNRNDPDPRVGQCVRNKDQVYFQASALDDRYLTGGRNKGNWDVYTLETNRASQFELQSLAQPTVSPSSQSTSTPSKSPSSKPSDSPSSNEDTIDSLRATIADLAATVISLEESIVQKDYIIADLSFQLDANCVPIDPTPSPTPSTDTPSIAPTKAPTSAQSLRPTNPPTLVPSATSTVAPWTFIRGTSCEGTKATIRSISGTYRPKVLSNCKSTCEYHDECVGFNYWDDNEVQTTECVFYSDITATPAKSYESEGRQDYITSNCFIQSHTLPL
jgi:hypothetical protein